MTMRKDITNQRFGLLVAVRPVRDPKRPRFLWECKCDCGGTQVADPGRLRRGAVMSCGCLRSEAAKRMVQGNVTHGLSKSRVFRIWTGMKSRCDNPIQTGFENYGGRGIKVCKRWADSFEDFLLDMGMPPDEKAQLDRIDVNGNYEPMNCRWISPKENSRNKRTNAVIEFNGISRCITEWAEQLGITHQALRRRINDLGWSLEKALTTGRTR